MIKKILLPAISCVLLMAAFSLNSCLKHPIEAPPIGGEIATNVVGNITVAELKALHPALGPAIFDSISEDKILKATVISDDRSGNFYKSITVQDATGGIEILLNRSGLFIDFPVGREVYIKLKGLVIGDYNGLYQVGGYTFATNNSPSLEGILSGKIGQHVLKGALNKPITPKETTIAALSKADWQTLVTLKDVQFSKNDTGKFYADYIGKASASSVLESCDTKTVELRTSGYSSFAANKKPSLKGKVTCVVGAYNNKPQLLLRDVAEVVLTEARCGGGGGTGGGTTQTGNGGGPGVDNLSELFDNVVNSTDFLKTDWLNYTPITGGRIWQGKTFTTGSEEYVQATAYQDAKSSTESWLISPKLNLGIQKTLTFISAMSFWKHDAGFLPCEVLFSSNYDGVNPAAATWTPLACTLASKTTANYVWVPSGNVLLPIAAKGFIAFKYKGDKAANTTSFRIDEIKVQ